jgi:hypothetical protein
MKRRRTYGVRIGKRLSLAIGSLSLFFGAPAYGQFPDDFKFGTNQSFSVGLWINTPEAQATDVSLFANKDWASGGNPGYVITLNSGGSPNRWKVNANTAGGSRIDTDWIGLDLNNWHYVVMSVDRGTGTVNAYTDGVLSSTRTLSGSSIDTWSETSGMGLDLNIGHDGTGAYDGGQSYKGLMDDVAIWNRPLTSSRRHWHFPVSSQCRAFPARQCDWSA